MHFGVLGFELLQFLQQHVEVVVAYGRRVKNIIVMVMPVQFGTQLKYAFLWSH